MHIHCPHCHNSIELVPESPREEINCPSCGSSFCLDSQSTVVTPEQAKRYGRFSVLKLVGQGGFGTVYKARDEELDRTIALKVPRAGSLSGSQELERFLREAQRRPVATSRHADAARLWRTLVADLKPTDHAQKRTLVFLGKWLPLPEADATRLAALASELLAQNKDAVEPLHVGAALFRGGQYEQAARNLEESIKLHVIGSPVDAQLFLGIVRQRLGQHAEARRLFDSCSAWYKAQDFKTWQEAVRWGRLHAEARALILTMPRAGD